MAKTYRRSVGTRTINRVYTTMTRLGVGASFRHILTVRGRRSGRLYATPVDVMHVDGARWLVAGYGPAAWVVNARATGEVSLSRGRHTATYRVEDVEPAEAVPVLRTYMRRIRVTRAYFDAAPDAPDASIEAELVRHPVLRLTPTRSDGGVSA